MVSRPRLTLALATVLLAGAAVALLGRGTLAAFSGQTSSGGSSVIADTDWTPPNASAAVAVKATGGDTGYIREGGGYYVYANVTDGGNPASGVASVRADAGVGPITLTAAGGPWTVDGVSYNHRSALQTAPSGAPAGTHPFSLDLRDSDSPANSRTQNGFSVVVDNTGARASDVQTSNGGIAGRPEQGDTITFTYTEPIERLSVLSGWTGTTADVVVRINDGTTDVVQVYDSSNSVLLPLTNATGLNLNRNDYVNSNLTFGATGTPSTMARSGNSITITLGSQSGAGTTAAASGTMSWTPSASATDRAGNPTSTTSRSESGGGDREF